MYDHYCLDQKLVREVALLDTMFGAKYLNVPQPEKNLSQQYKEVINETIAKGNTSNLTTNTTLVEEG